MTAGVENSTSDLVGGIVHFQRHAGTDVPPVRVYVVYIKHE